MNISETIQTLALVESGVDTGEVVREILKECRLLTGFKTYFARTGTEVELQGALAMVVADSVQLSHQCRHGGAASTTNCPNCTCIIEDRLDTTLELNSSNVTRFRMQTDCIIDSINTYLLALQEEKYNGGRVPISRCQNIRREFGVSSLRPSWFLGAFFDEHRQGLRDAEHLIYYGLLKQLLNFLTTAPIMKAGALHIFISRVSAFQWPKGTSTLAFDFNPKRGQKRWGTEVSMTMYKQLGLCVLFCLDGLVDRSYIKHYSELWLWHIRVLYLPVSHNDVPALQEEGLRILEYGEDHLNEVYDRPNGHGLLEFIKRTLPLIVNVRFAMSGRFEKHHQPGKRVNVSRNMIMNSMNLENKRSTLRHMFHGMKWGPNREYALGPGLMNLCNYGRGKEQKPHRLLLQITKVLPEPQLLPHMDSYDWNTKWTPSNMVKRDALGKLGPLTMAPSPREWTAILRFLHEQDPDTIYHKTECTFQYPRILKTYYHDATSAMVRVGDSVQVNPSSDDPTAQFQHCIIIKIIEVRHKITNFIVFIPRWYDVCDGKERRHPIRGTRIVKLLSSPDDAPADQHHVLEVFSVDCINHQVMIVHACHDSNVSCVPVLLCPQHGVCGCTQLSCIDQSSYVTQLEHNILDNPHFEIVNEVQGYHASQESRAMKFWRVGSATI